MQRCFTNILTDKVAETALFYESVLGLEAKFSSDWFVNLAAPGNSSLELGILKKDHEIVPREAQASSAAALITFVVDDCDEVLRKANEHKAVVVEHPKDMPYGQRRMILKDPAGTFVDVSSLIR